MSTENRWEIAQGKERSSWLETDMDYNKLLKGWLSRSDDFAFLKSRITKKTSILDVGAGPVSVLHTFPKSAKMVALDPLENEYKKKYKRLDFIDYMAGKAEKLNFSNDTFDIILCINALDHVQDSKKVLREMRRCLKPGGYLMLEYENSSPLTRFLGSLGYKKPLHDFHPILISNSKVFRFFKKRGMQLVSIKTRPQLSVSKIKGITRIILGQQKRSSYEQNTSYLSYGKARAIFHYFIILLERIFFVPYPISFAYFTSITVKKCARRTEYKERYCPSCGSEGNKFKYQAEDMLHGVTKKKFSYYECLDCSLVFTYPTVSASESASFYPTNYYSYQVSGEEGFFNRIKKNIFRKAFDEGTNFSLIEKLLIILFESKYLGLPLYKLKSGKFLDIGCGVGNNLQALSRYGWKTCGIELDPVAVKKARQGGLDVSIDSIESANFSGKKFDCIRMWHVLEHVNDLNKATRKLKTHLNIDGEILIAVPNTASLAHKIFGKYWYNLDAPRHLVNFNPTSLQNLFTKHNLVIDEVKYISCGGLLGSLSNFINKKLGTNLDLINSVFLVLLFSPIDFLIDKLKRGDVIFLRVRHKKTKRILITEPCYENYGGYFRAFGIAESLSRKGIKVDLILSSCKKIDLSITKKRINKNLTQYTLPRIEINHFITGRLLRAFISLYFVLFKSYDIVHTFALVQLESNLPFLLAKVLRKKTVIDWDDYWTDAHKLVPIYNNPMVRGYLKFCEYQLQKLAKNATTTSSFLNTKIKGLGIKNSLKIINGVNKDQFKLIGRSEARQKLGIPEGKKIIISFGHTFFKERTIFLARTFENIFKMDNSIELYFNQDFKKLIKEQARGEVFNKDMFKNIKNVGYLDKQKLSLYMSAVDCVLFTMGNSTLEKACFPTRIGTYLNGEKTILTNLTDTQACQTLQQMDCAIIGNDTKDLAIKTIQFFENSEYRERLETRTKIAKEELSWPIITERLINFYDNML